MVDVQVELSLAEAALDYAGMGLAVHPLAPRSKGGAFVGYMEQTTCDPVKVAAWWQEEPERNIGTTPRSNDQIVKDIDPADMEAWGEVSMEFGRAVMDTWVAKTPRGGYHVHFGLVVGDKEEPAGELVTRAGKIKLLWNGNCVMPPSVHPNGGTYEWVPGHAPWEIALAPLPAALRARIMRPVDAADVPEGDAQPDPVGDIMGAEYWLAKYQGEAAMGNRHDKGWDLACQLRADGYTEEAARPFMVRFADHCATLGACDEPARKHMAKVLRDAFRMKAFKMRPATPGGPLPEEPAHMADAPLGIEEPPPGARAWDGPDMGASGNGRGSGVEYVVDDRVEPIEGAGADDKITAPGLEVPAKRRTHWTAAELLAADLPAPVCVVPGLLLEGLTILAGRPKLGKSFMALQLAVAVASGGVFLDRRVSQGRVLYIALEDSPRRLQERLRKMGVPADCDGLALHLEWPALNGNGVGKLRAYIGQHRPALVVIDTLSRAVGGALDWDKIGVVTDLVGPLQTLAQETGTAVLAVDHHRKGNGNEDVIDDVAGSTGKTAVADTLWGLYRDRTDHGARLVASGRDVETGEVAIQFDGLTACWQVKTGATQGNRGKILDAIAELGVGATVMAIVKYLGLDQGYVSKELADLTQRGLVQREGRGKPYMLTARGADLAGDT